MSNQEQNIKAFMSSAMYADKKAALNEQINGYALVIDRSVFVKTPQEREELKVAKARYKEAQRKLKH